MWANFLNVGDLKIMLPLRKRFSICLEYSSVTVAQFSTLVTMLVLIFTPVQQSGSSLRSFHIDDCEPAESLPPAAAQVLDIRSRHCTVFPFHYSLFYFVHLTHILMTTVRRPLELLPPYESDAYQLATQLVRCYCFLNVLTPRSSPIPMMDVHLTTHKPLPSLISTGV